MWIGRLIGAALGFAAGNFIGLLIGLWLGYQFDKGFGGILNPAGRRNRQQIEHTFFRTVFLVMGRLAKADGRISEEEIALTEQLMAKMGLHSEHRQQAIALFKEGAAPDFDLSASLNTFKQHCGRHPNLIRQLLNYLLALALADGVLGNEEEKLLRQIGSALGITSTFFDQLIRMAHAQSHFRGYGGEQTFSAASRQDEIALAYQALGIDDSATDAEIKKAYRKLMSENHPDKLMGQGLPEDMIALATERSQEIQTAYELIKKARNG